MPHSKPVIAFVNPICSTVYLADALSPFVTLVAVYSDLAMDSNEEQARIKPELFHHAVFVKGKTEQELVVALKQLHVTHIFYGYENSVPLTDRLAHEVCPHYTNDIKTSLLRCNKFEMQDILKHTGVAHAHQIKIEQSDLTPLQKLEHWTYPVFIKPTEGSGTVGVKQCDTISEVMDFFSSSERYHSLDKPLDEFVIQELLVGDEYYIDAFSFSGRHYVTGVFRYEKTNYKGCPIYRYSEVVDPVLPVWRLCVDYVMKVLDAVGLGNGFSHTELFLTNRGPVLIEVNPRISGGSGFPNQLSEATVGITQPKLLLNALFNQKQSIPMTLLRYGRLVCLQNWVSGTIHELNDALIRTLPSYHAHLMLKPPGTVLDEPKTLSDTVAFVLLVNPSKTALLNDYERLIDWECDQKLF
jgi:biotin carboxylase